MGHFAPLGFGLLHSRAVRHGWSTGARLPVYSRASRTHNPYAWPIRTFVLHLVRRRSPSRQQQFATSPDLNTELLNAIMGALDAHNAMSTRALNS